MSKSSLDEPEDVPYVLLAHAPDRTGTHLLADVQMMRRGFDG